MQSSVRERHILARIVSFSHERQRPTVSTGTMNSRRGLLWKPDRRARGSVEFAVRAKLMVDFGLVGGSQRLEFTGRSAARLD